MWIPGLTILNNPCSTISWKEPSSQIYTQVSLFHLHMLTHFMYNFWNKEKWEGENKELFVYILKSTKMHTGKKVCTYVAWIFWNEQHNCVKHISSMIMCSILLGFLYYKLKYCYLVDQWRCWWWPCSRYHQSLWREKCLAFVDKCHTTIYYQYSGWAPWYAGKENKYWYLHCSIISI